jgi:hypothetical protein
MLMRFLLSSSAVLLLAFVAGCANTRFGFLNRDRDVDRAQTGAPPSKEAVVAYLNENAGLLQTIRSDELDITVYDGIVPFSLRGKMMTQKPRGFRMSGDALGNRVVDLGSNDNEFWWWISKANPPDQFFCNYKDLSEGRVQFVPFPFQPEWIMETLGLGPYGPAEKYQYEVAADTLRLIEKTTSAQGKAVRKVIVMSRRREKADLGHPQVTQFLLVDDATGQEICSAHISQVQVNAANGAVVPRKLELRWPAMKVRLAMKLDATTVNGQLPHTAFERPQMAGVRSVDLARLNLSAPTSVQRVQGMLNP